MALAKRATAVVLLASIAVLTGLGAAMVIQWVFGDLRDALAEWTDNVA